MHDNAAEATTASVPSVIRQFWLLLGMILCLAVISSALAVRIVALPYLAQQQSNAAQEQANKAARQLAARLERHQLLMTFVARDPNIVNLAIGHSENTNYLPTLLGGLPTPDALSWVTFMDVVGDTVSHFDVRPDDRAVFADADLSALGQLLLDDSSVDRSDVLLTHQGETAFLVMATPVRNQAFTEGVLLAGYRLPLDVMFPHNDLAMRTALVTGDQALEQPQGFVTARVAGTPLSVAMEPDPSALQAVGNALISQTVIAIALVLSGAFAIFAVLGRTVIIMPHKRLAKQAWAMARQQQDLAELASIAECTNDAVIVMDLDGVLTWANPAFERLSGYTLDEVKGRPPWDLLQSPQTSVCAADQIENALRARTNVTVEIEYSDRQDAPYWVSLNLAPLRDANGSPYGFFAVANDITQSRAQHAAILSAKHEIEKQALHDALTGLPNRRALDLALKDRAKDTSVQTTLVRIDLDHFKHVNDTMGHEAGDFVLREVAKILREETKATDTPARVGGDEFVLLLGQGATASDGMAMAERMLARIRAPMRYDNKAVQVGASFGVASTGTGLLNQGELIIGADAALYDAKENGRNRAQLYTPTLHRTVLERRGLANALRRAITRNEFVPFFQPQFDAKSLVITGVETLVRWRSPEFGLVPPDRFLPIAEQLSLVEEIDDLVFDNALSQITALHSEGLDLPKLSVNVTAQRIQDSDVFEEVRAKAKDGPKIAFEVLESVLVEEQSEQFSFGLDRLRDAGVEIEIDDFGSGHASIIGLMHLRPDAMKVDQRLVKPILQDVLSRHLLKKIVEMASLLDLKVIAEGVETMDHARLLREIGCDVLQGYALCEPMPVESLRRFVLAHEPDRTKWLTRAKA